MEKKNVIRHQLLSSLPQTQWLMGWDRAENWWSMLENKSGNPGSSRKSWNSSAKITNSSVYPFLCCLWPIKREQKRSGILLYVYMREEGEWEVRRAELQKEFTRNLTHTHGDILSHINRWHTHTFNVLHKTWHDQKKTKNESVTSLSYLRHF